jgi:hypothetical protein
LQAQGGPGAASGRGGRGDPARCSPDPECEVAIKGVESPCGRLRGSRSGIMITVSLQFEFYVAVFRFYAGLETLQWTVHSFHATARLSGEVDTHTWGTALVQ